MNGVIRNIVKASYLCFRRRDPIGKNTHQSYQQADEDRYRVEVDYLYVLCIES